MGQIGVGAPTPNGRPGKRLDRTQPKQATLWNLFRRDTPRWHTAGKRTFARNRQYPGKEDHIKSPTWNPQRYLNHQTHRARPALELLSRIELETVEVVLDLGCGPGDVTRALAQRWPTARVLAVDSSEEMLARARDETGSEGLNIEWTLADIESIEPEALAGAPPDVMYSNAALHWLDRHERLFPRLATSLRVGGVLAVQMPLSHDCASHRILRERLRIAAQKGVPRADALLARLSRRPVLETERYYDLLSPRCRVDLWQTTYLQVLHGNDPVLDWVRGTLLRPVLHDLEGTDRESLLAAYGAELRTAYPQRSDGTTLYPFPRLFLLARRER